MGEFPSKENQFKPGNNANPGGRPKGRGIRAALNRLMAKEFPGKDGQVQNGDDILAAWLFRFITAESDFAKGYTAPDHPLRFEAWKHWDLLTEGAPPEGRPGDEPAEPARDEGEELPPPVEDPREARRLELFRLDRMALALWPQVEAGDHKACNQMVRIMGMRIKLLGIKPPPPPEAESQVVERYEASLDKVYGDKPSVSDEAPGLVGDAGDGGVSD